MSERTHGAVRRIDWSIVILWLLVLGPAALIFRDWLFSLKPLDYADWPYFAPQTMADFWPPHLGWNGFSELGASSAASLPSFLLHLSLGLASRLHIPFFVYERIVFYFPALALCIAGPYVLTLELTGSKTAGIVASAAALFNGYWLRLESLGQISILVAEGLLPVFVLIFIRLMRGVTFARCAAMTAVLGAMIAYDLRIAYIAVLLGLLMGLGYFVLQPARAVLKSLLAIGSSWLAALAIIHAAWLLPSLYYHRLEPKLPSGFDSRGWFDVLSYFTLPEALTQYHHWPIPVYGFTTPAALPYVALFALALVPIIMRPRSPWVVGFTLLMLTFALLVKGAREPLSAFNYSLFQHVPGMYAFRDPSKFDCVIIFTQAALTGCAAMLIARRSPRLSRVVPVAAITLVLLANTYMFSPFVGGTLRGRDVPTEYTALIEYIARDRSFSRVLWIPRRATFHLRTSVHPMVEALADLPGAAYPYIEGNSDNSQWTLGWMEQPYAGWLMRNLAVDYVVVPDEVVDEQAFRGAWSPRARVVSILAQLPWLEYDRHIGGIDVYRVKQPRGLVTASSSAIAMRGVSIAGLRHFESASLPDGAAAAPVLMLPGGATPPPATVELDVPAASPRVEMPQSASALLYGGGTLVLRAPGPTDAGLVGAVLDSDGLAVLAAQRSFFPSDADFIQPPAGSASSVTFTMRVKPARSLTRFELMLFCTANAALDQCADGYGLEWSGGEARLVRHRFGIRLVLATRRVALSDAWHDVTLSSHHPDVGTQLISGAIDGSVLHATDEGDQIVYRGGLAMIVGGGDLRIDTRHLAIEGQGGQWVNPVSSRELTIFAPTRVQIGKERDLRALPIGDARTILRVPVLDREIASATGPGGGLTCGESSGPPTGLPFLTPLYGKPVLAWGPTRGRSEPAWIGLLLRDGQGEMSCMRIPIDRSNRSIGLEAYVAYENAAARLAQNAQHRNDYAWRLKHPVPAPAGDYVLTGLALPAHARTTSSMHVALDVDRDALAPDVGFLPHLDLASTRGNPAAVCAAFRGNAYGDRWSNAPLLLLTSANQTSPDEFAQREQASVQAFTVGVGPPRKPDTIRKTLMQLEHTPGVEQSGVCAYRLRSRAAAPEVRIDGGSASGMPALAAGAHELRPASLPLSARAAGVLLAGGDLLRIRSIPVALTPVGSLDYRVEVPSPAWLVFRQGYDEGWVARMGAAPLLHASADDLFNAYYVPRASTVEIEYEPRRLAAVGEIISTAGALALALYLLTLPWRGRR